MHASLSACRGQTRASDPGASSSGLLDVVSARAVSALTCRAICPAQVNPCLHRSVACLEYFVFEIFYSYGAGQAKIELRQTHWPKHLI